MCNYVLEGIPNKAQAAKDTTRGRSKPQASDIVVFCLWPKNAFN